MPLPGTDFEDDINNGDLIPFDAFFNKNSDVISSDYNDSNFNNGVPTSKNKKPYGFNKKTVLLKLKEIWGYDTLKKEQLESIKGLLEGNDVLTVLPTGFGKSVCFQLPGLLLDGMTVVVTPLLSLMEDQVTSFNEKDDFEFLKEKGIAAAFLNSNLTTEEKRKIYTEISDNRYKFLYVTPERFTSDGFSDFIKNLRISSIVIDEAHCIQTYGLTGFRPAYLELGKVIRILRLAQPNVQVSALSGTVSGDTLKTIEKYLNIKFGVKILGKAYKENISVITSFYDTKKMALKKLIETAVTLKSIDGKILIFGGTIKDTRDLSKLLKAEGLPASYYYAGLAATTKSNLLKNFKSGKIKYLCATSAFGMGIDIPDIRAVFHYCIPTDMESYVQEIGRAGRDGKLSTAILFGSKKDVVVSRAMLFGRKTYTQDNIKLNDFVDFIKNSDSCKQMDIARFFGNDHLGNCGICKNCLEKDI